MRLTCCAILFGFAIAACASRAQQRPDTTHSGTAPSQALVRDCLGPDSIVKIEPGQIGALRLDLTLRELHRLCPNMRDTIARGDESLDTAVVISRPGLAVVGRVATIGSDEGSYAYEVDSSRVIARWTVTGSSGLLPDDVPLDAPWDSLARAFGSPQIEPLNGDVYVWFCNRVPELIFHFDDPLDYSKPGASETFPSALAGRRIASLDLPGQSRPPVRSLAGAQ